MSRDQRSVDFESLTAEDSPLTFADVVASAAYRDLSTPKVATGDLAFDFTLPVLTVREAGRERTGTSVTLSTYAGVRPVALIFGSYT